MFRHLLLHVTVASREANDRTVLEIKDTLLGRPFFYRNLKKGYFCKGKTEFSPMDHVAEWASSVADEILAGLYFSTRFLWAHRTP